MDEKDSRDGWVNRRIDRWIKEWMGWDGMGENNVFYLTAVTPRLCCSFLGNRRCTLDSSW